MNEFEKLMAQESIVLPRTTRGPLPTSRWFGKLRQIERAAINLQKEGFDADITRFPNRWRLRTNAPLPAMRQIVGEVLA